MKKPVSLLLAACAVGVALGLPALAALQDHDAASARCAGDVCAARLGDDSGPMPLVRVGGKDDDDDEHEGGWFSWVRGHGGHDDDDDDGECEDDDDDGCRGAGGKGNPAPAGTAAPPANGLFGNGAPPSAVTN